MKKILFLFVFIIILMSALALPVFAVSEGSIVIDNYDSTKTYTAYKIFDVTFDGNGHYSYVIDSTSQWWSIVNGYESLTKTQIGNSTQYIITEGTGFSPANFANTLYANVSGKTATGTFINGTLAGMDFGYYFVTTTSGSVCSITTTDPTANIVDKSIAPDITKTVDDEDKTTYVGQVVTFTINGALPKSAAGFTKSYTYKINDTMTDGLTFDQSSVQVKIDGNTYTPTEQELTKTTDGFELKLDLIKNSTLKTKLGKNIEVTYSAKVNNIAITSDYEKNTAKLTYSNDPEDNSSTAETTLKEVVLKTANIKINKIIQGTTTKLAGAKFTLKNSEGKYYTYDDSNKTVIWQDVVTEYTSDGINEINFNGLDAGTYTLTETEAPNGYNRLTNSLTIVIDNNAEGDFIIDSRTSAGFSIGNGFNYVVDIANATGTELPSTGSKGTIALITMGTLLFGTTAIVLVTKKRLYNEG